MSSDVFKAPRVQGCKAPAYPREELRPSDGTGQLFFIHDQSTIKLLISPTAFERLSSEIFLTSLGMARFCQVLPP